MYVIKKGIGLVLFLFLAFFLIMLPAAASVRLPASLEAPLNVSVKAQNAELIISWENPSGIPELSDELYKSFDGYIRVLIDWRLNGGPWHFAKPIPDGQFLSNYYFAAAPHFLAHVYDPARNSTQHSSTSINKLVFNVPFDMSVYTWLKSNKLEFRLRYVLDYFDESTMTTRYIHSDFSNIAVVGAYKGDSNSSPNNPVTEPEELPEKTPKFTEPAALGAPDAFQVADSKLLTLKWQNPEEIKALIENNRKVAYEIDWRMNEGDWFLSSDRALELTGNYYIAGLVNDLETDAEGYVIVYIDPSKELVMPESVSPEDWLANHLYEFRARFIYEYEDKKHNVTTIVSPYSGTCSVGNLSLPESPEIKTYNNASDWAVEELNQADEYGLVTENIKKDMRTNITREEFTELVVRLYETYKGTPIEVGTVTFKDTDNPEILKAATLNLVEGTGNNEFSPNRIISRQEMATILYRALQKINNSEDYSISEIWPYSDHHLIEPWAVDGVYYCTNAGIIVGTGINTFDPQGLATREQAVLVCKRAYDFLKIIESETIETEQESFQETDEPKA